MASISKQTRQDDGEGSCVWGLAGVVSGPPPLVRTAEMGWAGWFGNPKRGSSELVDESDTREGMESVSEAGGVTRRGESRSAERGMELIVLKVFRRSW